MTVMKITNTNYYYVMSMGPGLGEKIESLFKIIAHPRILRVRVFITLHFDLSPAAMATSGAATGSSSSDVLPDTSKMNTATTKRVTTNHNKTPHHPENVRSTHVYFVKSTQIYFPGPRSPKRDLLMHFA